MKKDVSKKRKYILIIALVVVVIALLIFLGFALLSDESDGGEGSDDKIRYHFADYDEDIFQNKAYLDFVRDLTYSSAGVEQLYSYEEDYEEASAECRFFLDYFHTVISGDYQSVSDFYVEGYFEEEPRFTMQMIYEPYVRYHSVATEEIDGEEVSLINFHVQYKIFKNNGTFRKGVSSNASVPQIYQLIKNSDGAYKIYRILDVEIENEG